MALRHKLRRRETEIAFAALSIEGGLISPPWLARVAQLQAGAQGEADYRVPRGHNLRDEIGRYWRIAQAHWGDLAAGHAAADPAALAEGFVLGLLRDSFGFGTLLPSQPVEIGGHTFPIGFRALGGRVPVVIAPAGLGLDAPSSAFGDGSRRRSAFGLAQELLNADDGALWALATDGLTLRLLRDNGSLTRPAWIEADLARIFAEQRYADFAALWLLAHESRFGGPNTPLTECALEAWRTAGREEGVRARDLLRRGVEDALVDLGQGFLVHPDNQPLRAALQSGALTTTAYFQELLRLIYRLLFLLTAEERVLLHHEGSSEAAKALYAEGYGMARLRERALRRSAHDRYGDLWEAMRITFRGVSAGEVRLGLPALAGIFSTSQCPTLDAARLENRALLRAIFKLAWLRGDGGLARVNWRDMGPEELGSVYESLLELVPQISQGGRQFSFATGLETKGNARKTTGSYYTPDDLVQQLLDSTLDPIIEQALARSPDCPDALLEVSIVDPACGSGHFLLAAARRVATHLARLRTKGSPSGPEYRHALRQVVGHCVYGVDLNPMAVELCKVSLWMEALEPGLPLTFLDAHVQHGNALLGTTAALLEQGIPDSAWEPLEGDDKKIASALKKRNRNAAEGQRTLDTLWSRPNDTEARAIARAMVELETAGDASPEALAAKQSRWDAVLSSPEYRHQKLVADAWCAAFMWPKQTGLLAEAAPTNDLWRQLRDGQGEPPALTKKTVEDLAMQHHFFHWHLQFPQIFAKGGFDVVLGNPPWIAHAGRAAQPLPSGVKGFFESSYESFADYPTTHGIFVSTMPHRLRIGGRLGFIIPASLSELGGYTPTRRAHDRLCEFAGELVDFGEGRFPGVTQPCMALSSRRCEGGRRDAPFGEPWPMARPDLTAIDRKLLERLAAMAPVPAELFGERGVQSDRSLAEHFLESSVQNGRFSCPIREGTDVREFLLRPPRFHVDRSALAGRIRSEEEFRTVRILIRQTARYPIAALSDGMAFRNSLLAGFDVPGWPPDAVVALLNSALVRWAHYQRFRDARQPVMPQVKIGHLRAIPAPQGGLARWSGALADLGRRLTDAGAAAAETAAQRALDVLVAEAYGLNPEERAAVNTWHSRMEPGRAQEEPKEEATHSPDITPRRRGRPRK